MLKNVFLNTLKIETGETIHQKFEEIFNKYKMKNTCSDQHVLRKTVVEFNSLQL